MTHGLALCSEYTYRYGKDHKSKLVILWCQEHMNQLAFPEIKLSSFPQVVKDQYRSVNPIKAYRDYYLNEKRKISVWTKRSPPKWWK